MTAIMAPVKGKITVVRILKCDAPSSRAASTRLSGIAAKALRMTSMLYVLIATGRISDQVESIRPRDLTFKYMGTRPPLKYIENRISIAIGLCHMDLFSVRK